MRDRFINAALWLSLAMAALWIVGMYLYVFAGNETNHTGAPIRIYGYKWAALAVVAAVFSWFIKPGRTRKLAVAVAVLAFFAAASLLAFHHLEIMMDYDDWARGNMPGRPGWSHFSCWTSAEALKCQNPQK